MIDYSNIGFHEATVVGFSKKGESVELVLDGVLTDEGHLQVALIVSQVSSVLIDDTPCSVPFMAAEDGEVLSLEVSNGSLNVIIEWNDFLNRRSFTKSYVIVGKEISLYSCCE